MSGYYKITRLFCYDCNKRSKIKDNKPVCVRCGSKNCSVTKVWTESTSVTDYNFPRFERSELIDTSQTQIFK